MADAASENSTELPAAPQWAVYAGESEGNPLVVKLDRRFGEGYGDRVRHWAVMVELGLPRVDGNGLPPVVDFAALEEVEAGLAGELAGDAEDWTYVVRTYGEGVVRFGFYAKRNGGAVARVERAVAGLPGHLAEYVERCGTRLVSDPKWEAYGRYFTGEDGGERGGERGGESGGSFRDNTPYDVGGAGRASGRGKPVREDQPWRGEEQQAHPEE